MLSRRLFFSFAASPVIVGVSGPMPALAQGAASERLALKGYDPVAYFTRGEAVAGVPQYEHVWDGARYRFATGMHRELFKAQPEKFAPQFGGSCAMNMANGVRREADPHNWVISNGNLYVFASTAGADRFRQTAAASAAKATDSWQSLKSMPTQ